MKRIVGCAVWCMLFGLAAFGQTFGEITGTVLDESGAVVPAVNVSVTNVATNATRNTVSNAAGVYVFPALPPGTYTLRAEKAGFKTFARSNIELQVQQSARIDIEMAIGQVTETIEVSAQAALLSSENATVGTVIENKRIVELPINGRNYLQLVALAPNVSFGFPSAGQAGSRQGGERSQQNISVAGQRSNFNRFTLDGVENTDPNFNSYVVRPSIDALQEFKVQSGVYPAEFGRGVTQINVSTKSGSNEFHGAVFEFLRNDRFDAKNYAFTSARPPKDPFKWNQFGFVLGGPVRIPKLFDGRNRLFFMSNYEWFRQRRQVQSVFSLPSTAMRSGNFSELPLGTQGIYDPLTRVVQGGAVASAEMFPGNTIPASRIHPVSASLLEFFPAPNLPNPQLRNNHVIGQGRPIDRDQFIQRFDFIESASSNWSGRYTWGDEVEQNEALRLNGTAIITQTKQWMVSNTRVFSPTMVNEARFGYTKFYNSAGTELAFSRDVVGELGIPGLPGGPPVQWGIPSVGFSGTYSGFGNDSEGPYENDNSAIQFINNFSWVRGKHSLKFGGEARRDNYNQVGNQFARGSFTFQRNATNNPARSGVTGDAFADYLLGEVYQPEAAAAIATAQFRATGFALYVDDVWKVTPKFTLNWGLRYELTPPWEDQTGRLFNGIVRDDLRGANVGGAFMLGPNNQIVPNPNAPASAMGNYPFFMRQGDPSNDPYAGIPLRWPFIEVRQDGSLGNRLVGVDRNDIAPRLGLTWAPTSKWVFRTGAGVFYSQDTGNPRFDMARNLAGRFRDNSSTVIPDKTWENGLAGLAGATVQVPRPYTFANPYDRRTPYTIQYLMNIQRELPQNTVLEIGYLGSVSHRLESLRAVNETIPLSQMPSEPNIPMRSPFPNFGRIQLVDNGGSGNYNSLGTKLTKRYSNGMTYLFSYTWSKSIDTATAIRNQGGDTLFPQNSYCRSCERARSSHDVRHRFVTSALWDMPFGRGRKYHIQNRAADLIAGGWQVGSILTLQTGFPITMASGVDQSVTGAFFDRPNSTGSNAALPRGQQDPQRFFDTSAFVLQPRGTHGNVGRNTLTSPGIIGWDFSVLKDFELFSLADNPHKLQFRFEAFNFPNHPNWGNPDANVSSAAFGRITGTRGNMRQLQFALKYIF
ncbi:MAG: TonB-dependent receptor [Bryobacteraceae bacterium]|nr:TonB-dependent receptor [Bryobacteraceae bacterium]